VSPESLPEVLPENRDARRRLPSRGSLGRWFPTFPTSSPRAPSQRDSAPLRLPIAHLGGVRFSLSAPDTLYHASFFVSLACERLVCKAGVSLPRRESFPRRSALLSLLVPKGTMGSPTFPSHPSACLPRSPTPVVSCTLALSHPGLLPSGHCTPSAFPRYGLADYPLDHDSTYFGAPSRSRHPRSIQLRTPMTGCARGLHS
jgi:hypothetical protein